MMGCKARVSAVFLLVSAIWVCGVWGDVADRRGASADASDKKKEMGVGTQSGAAGEKVQGTVEAQEAVSVGPRAVFREVEKGWRDCTPKPFERHLGKGKVRLDFGEGGPRDGLYTKSQAYYLIAEYLKKKPTLKISMVKMSDDVKKGSRPYAFLERTHRWKNKSEVSEVIFVALKDEDKRWVISEMRAVPNR